VPTILFVAKLVGTRSLSSGAHTRDPLASPTLRKMWTAFQLVITGLDAMIHLVRKSLSEA
jgi:hypothetical protein